MELKAADKIIYFILTIVVLSSIGITMPMITDLLGSKSCISKIQFLAFHQT